MKIIVAGTLDGRGDLLKGDNPVKPEAEIAFRALRQPHPADQR
jgi:hypothetical protein